MCSHYTRAAYTSDGWRGAVCTGAVISRGACRGTQQSAGPEGPAAGCRKAAESEATVMRLVSEREPVCQTAGLTITSGDGSHKYQVDEYQ